ncbi:MAG TPA: hypothetical protein VGG01_16735 [Xanthobacteraceae bacterium]|jgi:hypothetical protein
MQRAPRIVASHPAIITILKASTALLALACIAGGPQPAFAQQNGGGNNAANTASLPAFAPGMIQHMQSMRRFPDPDRGAQPTPPVIPRFSLDGDAAGAVATFQPGGATFTFNNAFFQNLGTNGRTCFTCHQPQTGWGVSAASVAARFAQSGGSDPIFRTVDGATCPSDNVATLAAKRQAYALLIDRGLIRIGLPMPASQTPPLTPAFEVTSVSDPYHCNTNVATGLTSKTTGIVSVYRRPLPSTNLGFLSTIMWDGREPTLASQATDATLGHAQAAAAPTQAQIDAIVAFESGLYTAQEIDNRAGSLHGNGAMGGPVALSLVPFFIGINDPLGNNPHGTPFTSDIFDIYKPWLSTPGHGDTPRMRASIARGEEVFNNTNINITGVGGLNDVLNQPTIKGFCGTCHDTPNVGDHSVKAPLDIGIAGAGSGAPPALDVSRLPVFTITCTSGTLTGKIFTVTDPGRALISNNCADIGKFKGPILRGLASRAPYFHNGSAASLQDVVDFYDQRFHIGFTPQQKADLVNFLNAL